MSRRQVRHARFAAAKVKEQRQALKLTNEDLAHEVGSTLRTVQRWQTGESTPRGFQAIRLAEVLGLDPADLYLEEAPAA